jgi:nucleoside-diphosphate-sugar epimerase
MKAFVTGGSGFIGKHVVRKLVERGYDVYALARSEDTAATVRKLGATPVAGDIHDVAAMRPGMEGSDVVFHLAGWYKTGARDWMQAEPINVGGTRKVLRLAYELGVPKIVYASTLAVFGDTHGEVVDEAYFAAGPFLTEYDRTKWLAHYKVAVPLIQKGAPVIIVQPGVAYGPGDHSLIGEMMRQFYNGKLPVLTGPETTFTYAHVEDMAEGVILAAEKGKIGESYILAGPPVSLGEMFGFWAQLTGKPAPAVSVPARFVRPLAPLVGRVAAVLPLPPLYNEESIRTLGATYVGRANKARAQLGWSPRPLHGGMMETFAWIERTSSQTPSDGVGGRERRVAGLALGAAVALLLLWLFSRRRQ